MRRYWASFILLIGVIFSTNGQTTTVFTENFEQPSSADSVTSTTTGTTTGFTLNTTYAAGGTQSILGEYGQSDTTILTTDPFSTVGNTFIILNFDHVAKIEFFDRAIIEVSDDGGTTWNTLSCPEYLGTGQFCGGGNKFTSVSYTDWQPANPSALPDPSWWKSESFDISVYASNTPNAQIRFILNDLNFSGQGANIGWLIDNIEVVAAPCELIPPSASYVAPILQNTAYTVGPFDILADITDGSGIDTAYVVYTLNGGAPDTIGMTNTTANTYLGSIPSAAVGDSICYYTVVVDASPCGNTTVIPSTGTYCFEVDNAPPPYCVGIPISTFPNLETFDSFTPGTGTSGTSAYGSLANNWTRNPGPSTTYGWCVRSAPTGSGSTGPSGDNTGNGNYLYTESSMLGNPATLTSPCYDFQNLTNPTLEFYYHMFGATMGTLEVQVFDGAQTTTVWTNSGAQQSSETDPFEMVTIPLSQYAGDIVQIIFRGTRGTSFTSDMAIDDVRVYEPQPNDAAVISVISPAAQGCNLGSTENVTVEVANLGTFPQDTIPVSYIFNGAPTVIDTLFQLLNPGDTVVFTFGQTVDLSQGGTTYTLDVWTDLPNEQTAVNDSILGYSVTNTLTTTPFIEDFQSFSTGTNTVNDWTQIETDNFDWNFRTGSTPSANTGPANDHTLGTAAGVYAYIETNGPLNGDQAILESPCLDFDTLIAPKIEFWYHMFGTTTGTLHLEALDANLNWISVWSLSGDQGNQWTKATADLSSVASTYSKIRFRAVSAGCCSGDIAIDDILIYEPQPDDVGVISFINPVENGCGYSSADSVTVSVANLGTAPQTFVPLAYTVDGGTPVLDTLFQTVNPGDTVVFTFSTTANFGTVGQTYDVVAYTNLAADTSGFNDTSDVTFTHTFTINAFPYTEDFETGTPGNGTPFTPGTLPTNWSRTPSGAASQLMWLVNDGTTGSFGTGPDGDHTPGQNGNGNYVYAEVSYGSSGNEISLISPCVDFGTLTNPHVEFYYHRFGTQMGTFYVDVLSGGVWNVADSVTATPQTAESSPYTRHLSDLSAYGGQDVRVRFRYIGQGCCAGDMAIDDIKFFEPVPNDLAVINVIQPGNYSPAGSANTVEVEIFNYGLDTITTSPVEYSINGAAPVTETWTGTLFPQTSTIFTFTTTFNAPTGQYDVCAWTDLPNEQAPLNDTTCKSVTGVQTITPSYFTDFESGAGSWVSAGGFNQWEYGIPTANTINNAYSGSNVWATNLDGNYLNNSDDYLYSPFFDMSTVIDCELNFYHWWNFEGTWDGARIDYSANGGTSWNVLGSATSTIATNWYTNASLISSSEPGWSNSSSGWEFSSYPLDFLNNNIGLVQFRFNISTDGSVNGFNGWAIDDFEIFAPIQLSGATSTINIPPSNNFILPSNKTVSAWVKNTGVIPLSSTDVTLEADGTVIVTDPLTFSVPLQMGDSILHTFSTTWTATPGVHDICVYTSNPNGQNESFVPDDTTCLQVTVFDAITSYPYCNDFESGLPPLVTLNAFSYDPNSKWEVGLPQKPFLNNTNSGQNAWVTSLTDDYDNRDSSALFTPLFDVNATNCYRLSFYHKFKTELYQDGGLVEYSTDAGNTWTVLGGYQSAPDWYNNQFTIGLSNTTPGLPGWSGTSTGTNGWQYAEFDMLFPNPAEVIFRFRFGSDFSVTDEGWAIDDICFDEIPACSPTSVEEYNTAFFIDAYPNPTSGNLFVTVESTIQKSVQFELVNMLGQTVFAENAELNAGENNVSFDFRDIEQGMYYLRMIDGSETVNQKVVISQ